MNLWDFVLLDILLHLCVCVHISPNPQLCHNYFSVTSHCMNHTKFFNIKDFKNILTCLSVAYVHMYYCNSQQTSIAFILAWQHLETFLAIYHPSKEPVKAISCQQICDRGMYSLPCICMCKKRKMIVIENIQVEPTIVLQSLLIGKGHEN